MSTNALQDQLHAEIDERFGRKKLTPEAIDRIEVVTSMFQEVAHALAELVPAGREFQTAITKLEESKFFANQALARDGVAA